MRRTIPVAIGLAWLVGCSSNPSIQGSVTDVAGNPLPGTTVTVLGTRCQTTAGADGTFSLSCDPGEWNVAIAQSGYLSKQRTVDATEGTHDLGAVALVRIPDEEGLLLFSGNEYTAMKPGKLLRGKPDERTKSWCVDREGSEPNEVEAGTVAFFDNRADTWRPWRLDDDGCAYRMQRQANQSWKESYGVKPKFTEKRVENERSVVLMELEPGEYFIADWRNGFFSEIGNEKDDAAKRYSGHWIVVK